jgi:D-serine dehydratase
VLRIIHGGWGGGGVTGGWRELYMEELHCYYGEQIKGFVMGGSYSMLEDKKNVYKLSVRNV